MLQHRSFIFGPDRLGSILPAALLATSLTLVGCGGGNGGADGDDTTASTATTDVTTPSVTPTLDAAHQDVGPQITFDKTVHDFGVITDVDKQQTVFSFVNSGSQALMISDVKAACGCTVPTLEKRRYEPGERGDIAINFDPKGKSGTTPKFITVISNSADEPQLKLKLESNIKPLLRYDRMQRIGTLALGEGGEHVVETFYRDPELMINSVSVNNDYIAAEIIEVGQPVTADDGEQEFRATIQLTFDQRIPWGVLYATRLTMDVYGRPALDRDPMTYSYDAFLSGSVLGQLKMTPTIIGIGRLTPGAAFEKDAKFVHMNDGDFEILGVEVAESTMPGVQVRSERIGPGQHRLIVFGNTGTFRGSAKGTIAVRTDIPGEEVIQARFSGFVQQ